MIGIGNREIEGAHVGKRALERIALGARTLWEAVSNCIAGGWWQSGHGWLHGTGWREKKS